MKKTKKNITIDGPAASGKTSIGQKVASLMGYKFLDTGLMYRAIALKSLISSLEVYEEDKIVELCHRTDIAFNTNTKEILVDGENITDQLRERHVDQRVSLIAKLPNIRKVLVSQQRVIADRNDIVMVGRDIGTVVLPGAKYKFYLTASLEIRAERRYKEFTGSKTKILYDEILFEMEERDRVDKSRKDSPLKPAKDAVTVDTTEMVFETAVGTILNVIKGTIT
ncbi:MAG: (d)CMP kinase [SAR202 cluster bacterium]|nr:cytidylate kinase [Chloroflexota bacterium]MQG47656.1 (d)CMP kinase [SAR202 cluster bacterium]